MPDTAGYDLYSVETAVVPPSSVRAISTNIGFKIRQGYFGKIHARSNFATQFTDVSGGLIDYNYRDPVVVLFFNFSNIHFEGRKGQRFAQIIFQKVAHPVLREVQTFEDCRTFRNQGVFGSTRDKKYPAKFKWQNISQKLSRRIWNGMRGMDS